MYQESYIYTAYTPVLEIGDNLEIHLRDHL